MSAASAHLSSPRCSSSTGGRLQNGRAGLSATRGGTRCAVEHCAGQQRPRAAAAHLAVELRYAERLNEMEVTPYEAHCMARAGKLFAIGAKAHALFTNYLSRASDEDIGVVLEFPTRTSGTLRSKQTEDVRPRMLHGVRHWAQLATVLREQGHGRMISFSAT